MEKAAKEKLFLELHQLDDEESETEDSSNANLILSKNKPLEPSVSLEKGRIQPASSITTCLDRPIGHTVSAPLSKQPTAPGKQAGDIPRGTETSVNIPPNSHRHQEVKNLGRIRKAVSTTDPKSMTKSSGKRKRGESHEMKPEALQIFKGSSFYFIPDNDIAPARRLRIKRSIEYGAIWVRQWQEDVTHIVADREITYGDILKYLKIPSLPANVILVNEVYPSDCLTYRFLVNPNQRYYHVEGQEVARAAPNSSTSPASSETSLQVKSDTRKGVQPQQSSSKAEGSDQFSCSQSKDRIINPAIGQQLDKTLTVPPKPAENALDEAIEETKAVQDLPLDLDEESTSDDILTVAESEEEHSEDERRPRMTRQKGSFKKSWQESFTCMTKHDGVGKAENPNAATIEILQRMADYYERSQDHWRFTAYRKAIGALKKQQHKVTSAEEAFAIPFIGQRLADKIEEIVRTNRLRRLEYANWEPNDEVLQLFMSIYGVGLKQATKWVDQGFRNVTDLVNKASLTKNQRIGVEHLEDFKTRIPRREMDRHDQYVREMCGKIDPTVQFTIGGSYRRGAADSGDVDFIVTKPDCQLDALREIVLETLIPRLFEKGYLKVGLATTAKDDGSKWHGAAALPGETIWRRIDFLLVPSEEFGAALIYFTGNDIFNRSIRLLASKKGMRLNQRGLWKDVMRGPKRERLTQGTLVEAKDERKIFEHLGVPWRPPEHRIC